jgi:hypothetical protein
MPVQVNPLDGLQSGVIQQAPQMIPHRPGALRFRRKRKPGIFIQQNKLCEPTRCDPLKTSTALPTAPEPSRKCTNASRDR